MNLNCLSSLADKANIDLLESQEPDCTDSNISPCKQDCSDYVGNIISRLEFKPSDCVGGSINHLESKAVKCSHGGTQ